MKQTSRNGAVLGLVSSFCLLLAQCSSGTVEVCTSDADCAKTVDHFCDLTDHQCKPRTCVRKTCLELGRQCGNPDDGCGGSVDCGTCNLPEICNQATGSCECTPDCAGRECGLDPVCGALSCGRCVEPKTCSIAIGRCEACTPDCGSRKCGAVPNGCGESCGTCQGAEICNGSECVVAGPPFYVRTDGNNACNGRFNKSGVSGDCAWRTIAYGLSQLVPGDTLRVQSGAYDENELNVPSGNSGNWVALVGDGNPVINATTNGFSHENNSYIRIEGFTIQGYDGAGYFHQGGTFSNISVINNFFIGGVHGVQIRGTGYGEDILVKGNDCSGQSGGGDLTATIDVGSAAFPLFQNIIIDGNNIHDQSSDMLGIQFNGINATIQGNKIDGVSKGITGGSANDDGNRVLYNTVSNCTRGIRFDYNNHNCEIGHNTVIDSGGQGWGLDLYPYTLDTPPSRYQYWIHDNIMDNSGIGIYSNYGDIIENNTFQNGESGLFIWAEDNTWEGNHTIRNNTFKGKVIDLMSTKGNITITNNRFYDKAEYAFNQFAFICWRGSANTGGLFITNNDFYNTNGMNAIESEPTSGEISPVVVTNNIFHTVASGLSDDSNRFGGLSISYNLVLANSAAAFGGKTSSNTLSEDPLFADPTAGDFHLKSQAGRWNGVAWVTTDTVISPAIDAGDPASPFDDEPLPNGGRINMGSYGNSVEASKK